MKLKRFVAKDMREALTMVKDELGADAIIMSNKRVAAGVEIVAGVESLPMSGQGTGAGAGAAQGSIASAGALPRPDTINVGGDTRAIREDRIDLSIGTTPEAIRAAGAGTSAASTANANKNNALSASGKNQAYAQSLIEILERQKAMSKETGDRLMDNIAAHNSERAQTRAAIANVMAGGSNPPAVGANNAMGTNGVNNANGVTRGVGIGGIGIADGNSGVFAAPGSTVPQPRESSLKGTGVSRIINPVANAHNPLDAIAAMDDMEMHGKEEDYAGPIYDGVEDDDMANDPNKKAGPSRIDPSLDEDADLFKTPPLPLSQQREFKNFFVKSKTKQEKEEYESKAGIDSYRQGAGVASDTAVRQDLEKMRSEVENIRKLLQFELAGLLQDNRSRNEPVKAMIYKLLHSVGFSDSVADNLVNQLPAEISFNLAWREIMTSLERCISVGDDEIVSKGGIVTLIGPAGVGKTTTLAKLAARFVMRYGPQRVAIVTADHYRIGAVEQIKTYGRIMGCSTFAVKNISELPQLLYSLSDKSLILVDTAGVGFKDERFNTQLSQLKLQKSLKLKHYLVLPCTTQRKVLQYAYNHFAPVGLTGLILTKIDECQNLGDALSLCIEMKLPISYITDGQRVPEDLDVPSPKALARRALSAVEDDAAQRSLAATRD